MKNELGIEICCENCLKDYCTGQHQLECKKVPKYFVPTQEAYEIRIKELQEQQFTEDELKTLNGILQDYFRVYTTQHYKTKPLLNKIERILNNEQ